MSISSQKQHTLPTMFKPLLWSYRFSKIDYAKDKRVIIINTINYGDLIHWRWLIKHYGKTEIKKIIEATPASTFRPPVKRLIEIIFSITFKHALRSTR